MNDNPFFSICITTFNRSDILMSSITNILNQSYTNFELIVIDDNSDDKHREQIKIIVDSISDPRVKFILNDENKGLARNRNLAISASNGFLFTFKDDDDKWDLDFLSIVYDEFSSDLDFIIGGYRKDNVEHYFKKTKLALSDLVLKGYTPPVGSQIYRTDLIKEVMYDENIRSGVDHDLWIRCLNYKPDALCLMLDKTLVTPDFFKSNMSGVKMTTDFSNRVNGIENSLNIWREDIEKSLGVGFFNHFKKQYSIYLNRRFITKFIKTKDIQGIVSLLSNSYTRSSFFCGLMFLICDLFNRKLSTKKEKNIISPLFEAYER
ncbi:glycosyltransferase family 2 protein [Acinetobacter venetianus]|uniref:glycosyltransferase family 2 protein n=1 Tax=Acinetobacter venetianus TaxID=52133 RepID=UPI003A919B16